ncbi:DUF3164 family protein [Zunongwangia profunda]|uniref:DUF3164 family protein n=1 Tax=Zunongwangia profunda TaxID=398743 RepID=UPI00248D8A1C|nr:DUF3164 family protein [Zunongwangia profunda]|tara:strand:+ start:6908 stop:7558 length:651 start_codon:yes stop_codon:yes gene_type:complete
METINKSIDQMSSDEIELFLAKKRKKEQAELAKQKKKYEADRDETINFLVNRAIQANEVLKELKELCENKMEIQAEALNDYGMMRSNSKGGFSITNSEGDYRVTRRRDTEPKWDERSTKAQELIKDFLTDTVKKRDLDLFEMLMSFIERNENGDLEYARVMILIQHEKKFNDPRWLEGLRLIKESYSSHLKGFGYELKKKGKNGKFQTIQLNFSSL